MLCSEWKICCTTSKELKNSRWILTLVKIKQYLPVSLVISGMLKMFQDLFGKMLPIN
jgi:Zn-dependent oligopeptidase